MDYKDIVETLTRPVDFGDIALSNRVVMAPMTRSRANQVSDEPTPEMADYYAQRAGAGMIITEGVQPSQEGKGYLRTPGIYNDRHVKAWSEITRRVHDAGGSIVMQLMHVGRIAHPDNKAEGVRTVAPSAIRPHVDMFTDKGMQPIAAPEAMSIEDIRQTQRDYQRAAELTFEAGFDGVELHCTSGYLPAQFLSTGTNQRDDEYGGSLENRLRFILETLNLLADVNGSGRVGMRICPANPFNDLSDADPSATFSQLLTAVSAHNLAYLHAIHMPALNLDVRKLIKAHFRGDVILNESYNFESAAEAIEDGDAKAISFGRPFIANPDLVDRLNNDWPLAEFKADKLYTPGVEGYSDYPNFQS